ncbi:hypothetical protein MLD38_009998 [Melastoma candidum]|uniref:Uncharacterized protein n=1 Tax=Melastoma candidum TaxID=119954 RepID=A0ACB9QZP9_9MYRT|nr:hypothetical protein MLD38_009998 [Melastoma candidum]
MLPSKRQPFAANSLTGGEPSNSELIPQRPQIRWQQVLPLLSHAGTRNDQTISRPAAAFSDPQGIFRIDDDDDPSSSQRSQVQQLPFRRSSAQQRLPGATQQPRSSEAAAMIVAPDWRPADQPPPSSAQTRHSDPLSGVPSLAPATPPAAASSPSLRRTQPGVELPASDPELPGLTVAAPPFSGASLYRRQQPTPLASASPGTSHDGGSTSPVVPKLQSQASSSDGESTPPLATLSSKAVPRRVPPSAAVTHIGQPPPRRSTQPLRQNPELTMAAPTSPGVSSPRDGKPTFRRFEFKRQRRLTPSPTPQTTVTSNPPRPWSPLTSRGGDRSDSVSGSRG